jgi:hypothetical protein
VKELIVEKKDIENFREVLTNHLEELLSYADNTVSGMTAPKEIHTRFVKSAVKIFPLLVSKPDRLRRIALIAKQKKRLPRETLDYDQYIPF